MEYDFGCDTEKISTLSEYIDGEIVNANRAIRDIYSIIDSLSANEIWCGESYTSFKDNTHKYKDDLENMIDVLKAYNKIIKSVESDALKLCEDVVTVTNIGE